MAQYATPDADIDIGNFTDQAAGTTNIFNSIDPDTPGSIASGDDTDYIESPLNPQSEVCSFGLSTIEDPASSSGHVMRWRRQKDAASGGQIDLTVELREGYVSEVSQGTLINSFSDNNVSNGFATTTDTLSAGEADSITDYADLQIRFSVTQST